MSFFGCVLPGIEREREREREREKKKVFFLLSGLEFRLRARGGLRKSRRGDFPGYRGSLWRAPAWFGGGVALQAGRAMAGG